MANGPNVEPIAKRGHLADVTPTLLALLGIPVPTQLDGKPLDLLRGVQADASSGTGAQSGGVEGGTAEGGSSHTDSGYTEEEEEAVRRRLEDLGYI